MTMNQSNWGRLAKRGGSAQVWENGPRTPPQRPERRRRGKRETTREAWSGICQETKLLRSENTREEERGEIKKKPYHCHETSVLLRGTGRHAAARGKTGQIPEPKTRGNLGNGDRRVRTPGPQTLCVHSPGLQQQSPTNTAAYHNRRVLCHSPGGQKSKRQVWAGPCSL